MVQEVFISRTARVGLALPALILTFGSTSSHPASAELELGAVGSPPAIVTPREIPLAAAARDRLIGYLQKVTGRIPQLAETLPESGPAMVLGDFSEAARYGFGPARDPGPESFMVAPIVRDGRAIWIVAGRTDQGIKQGIYHVLRNVRVRDEKLLLPGETVRSAPFISLRGSHLGGYTRRVFDLKEPNAKGAAVAATPEQMASNHWEYWEPARITDYIDMLDFFGYNLVETPPRPFTNVESATSESERKKARRRLNAFLDRVRQNGLRYMLKFNGTLFGRRGPVPYGPDTGEQYERHYRRIAELAGPHADMVLTHWVDAGGWANTPEHPCTIDLLQDLHMQIDAEFNRVNPEMGSVLSLWFLDHRAYQKWVGYQGVDTILESEKVPARVGLAMSRTYRPKEARKIVRAGHKAGVWGWYIADHELVYTMHVHTHPLKEYFQELPEEAAKLLNFHTLSNCQAETNLYSIYVGARMMWNPRQDPEVYLREIARLIYGPAREEAVFQGLKAIADVRCGKKCGGYWNPGPKSEAGTVYDGTESFNGVLNFDQACEQALSAWDGLKDVEVDTGYTPPIRFHRPLETLLAELKGHVEAVATYMQVLKDRREGRKPSTEVPSARGPFEYYERMQYLHPGEVYWPRTVVQ